MDFNNEFLVAEAVSIVLTGIAVVAVIGLLFSLARRDWPSPGVRVAILAGPVIMMVSCLLLTWGGLFKPWLFYDQASSVAVAWRSTEIDDVGFAWTVVFLTPVVAVTAGASLVLVSLARRTRLTRRTKVILAAAFPLLLLPILPALLHAHVAMFGDHIDRWVSNLNRGSADCHYRLGSVEVGWSAEQLARVMREPLWLNDSGLDLARRDNSFVPAISLLDWPPSDGPASQALHGHRVIQSCHTYTSGFHTSTWYEFRISATGTVVDVSRYDHTSHH